MPALAELPLRAPWTREALDEQRHVGDPIADRVIDELRKTVPIRNPHDLLALVRERARSEGGVYRDFVEACNRVPAWADFEAMRPGQDLIAAANTLMGLSLLTGSLVGGYIFVKASLVTSFTGRLAVPGDIGNRLAETAAMVLYLSKPAEIRPGGRAHETLVRVRLLHGAIRHWIAESGRWREEWDLPVCQEDLAITLSLFSFLNMRNLYRMGARPSDARMESHHLLWRWVGHVLGIREELLSRAFDVEVQQFHALLRHEARPQEGFPEARNILDEIADKVPLLSSATSRKFLYQVTAHLMGDELVERLEIRSEPGYAGIRLLRGIGLGWTLLHEHVPGGRALLTGLGRRRIDGRLREFERAKDLRYAVKIHDPRAVREALRQKASARPGPPPDTAGPAPSG